MEKIKKIISDYKVIIINVFASFAVKGGSLVITVLVTPAYMRYFNDNAVLGVWYTMLSILTAVRTLDIGIGNGLRNKLTEALAEKNSEKAKSLISSAYIVIGIFSSAVALFSIIGFRYIPWHIILNISQDKVDVEILSSSMTILFCGIMIHMVLKLITSILYSLQRSAVINAMDLLSSILILLYISFAPDLGANSNLIRMSFVHVGAVNIPMLVATIIIFNTSLKKEKPTLKQVKPKVAQNILTAGLYFFFLQIVFMLISSVNEYLITYLCDPKYTVYYQVYHKVFGLISGLFTLAMLPVWSAITKAKAEGNYTWIIRLYRILQVLSLVIIGLTLCIVPFMQIVVDVWLQEETIKVDTISTLVFCIANAMLIWHNVNTSIANGMSYLKPQLIFLTIGGLLKVPIAYLLVKYTGEWYMVMMSNIIALLPLSIAQPIMVNRLLHKKGKDNEQLQHTV